LVTATLSSSLDGKLSTSSFNSYTASAINGTISGSSQLTSSFDQRYVVSGSITQTTWDNIANKPSGIVSQSTDLSSLNTFTASISTASLVNRLNAIESVSGSWITESETGSFLTSLSGAISSSTQISDLGFVTGSYTTINSFNSLTQSFNSISQSFNVISGSVGTVDFNGIVSGSSQVSYTGLSNIPAGIISGSSQLDGTTITNLTVTNLTTVNQTSSVLFTSGSNQLGDELADIQILSGSVRVQGSLTINGTSVSTQSFVDVSALNSATSSYETKGRSIISSSAQITTLGFVSGSYLTSLSGAISSSSQLTSSYDTRYVISGSVGATPSGTISGSAQITAFGFISSSQTINTGSLATTGSNSFNGNQTITGSLVVSAVAVVNGGITVPTGSVITLTTGSSISVDSSGAITGSLTGSVFGIGDVVAFSASVNSRIISGSSVAGTISGSSQLTSSFDTRYVLSGSVSAVPAGTISGSSQLTSSYDSRYSLSGSVLTSFSSSVDTRLDTLEATIISGSVNYVQTLGARVTGVTTTGVIIITGSITTTGNPIQIMVTGDANPIGGTAWTRLQIYRDSTAIGNVVQVENTSNLNVPYCLNVIDTPSAGTYTYSMRPVSGFAGTFDFGEHTGPTLTAVELKSQTSFQGITLISGSSQLTSSYDTRYTLSGSISAVPVGTISGSSQLTSSYDTRYTLSGSVVSGTTPAGTISGSSQLTSSFDGRYTQTGSFNTLTASFNSFTASAQSVTTGSNSFNGTQIITGSLIITTGSFVASQILANTASLYLTSGSNMYVQNNGVVEITGSLRVSGSTMFASAGGDEGGEIQFGIPTTNTTLQNRVTTDVFQNRYRIFEGSADAKGVYIDLSKAPAGVGGELLTKASGLVNRGVDVTLGNLKARIAATGNVALQLSTVSGTYSVYGSSVYSQAGAVGTTIDGSAPKAISTTPAYLNSGYNFGTAGATDTWNIMDTSNSIAWRITMILGAGVNNNLISIERIL
jgi:hypothetical protein